MYRVELKGLKVFSRWKGICRFLMYRVELKAYDGILVASARQVPNVPCGVESN